MMVRSCGRRNPPSSSQNDSVFDFEEDQYEYRNDVVEPFSLHQDFFSQESSSSQQQQKPQALANTSFNDNNKKNSNNNKNKSNSLASFDFDADPDPYASNSGQGKENRKQREAAETMRISSSTTLMEAQEYGEMMEHVDEVNFALDGLRKGQPVRIRRASLLSLLGISGTQHQRRLLRAQGLSKTMLDGILGLTLDDSASNLAAAALFYVLTGDGQDDHLLESPSSIRFLIKLLKPVVVTTNEGKARNIGSKLLALRKDLNNSQDTSKVEDSSLATIEAKVKDILVSNKDFKPYSHDISRKKRPELCPKWIALLIMEKACVSKISLEGMLSSDISGGVKKTGGNFKEKLRELGGLDAVFEVAMNCFSVMEHWTEYNSLAFLDAKDGLGVQSLALLLKCLKIMENAAFLSTDNQCHFLGIRGKLDSSGRRLSFTKLIINLSKILSGLYLLKGSAASNDEMPCISGGSDRQYDLSLIPDCKADRNAIMNLSQTSTSCSSLSASSLGAPQMFMNGTFQLKMRLNSSTSSSCSEKLKSSDSGTHLTSNGLKRKYVVTERPNLTKDSIWGTLDDNEDPFAFDEDEFQPSKWELMSGRQKVSRRQNDGFTHSEPDEGQYQLMSQEVSSDSNGCNQTLNDVHSSSNETPDEHHFNLLADCLLTAVKVLMNLTNDNPIGCQQIAASGGLEIIPSLIAAHFPSFSSSMSFLNEMKGDYLGSERGNQNDKNLTDQELDFLVALLGLLVNLVEKDRHNRSRLAAASVLLPNSEGPEEDSQRDVIPLLCSIFLANQGAGDASGEGSTMPWNTEEVMLQGEKEAEKMIVEAYTALLLAFLSTESKSTRDYVAEFLPDHNLSSLVPVLERFVEFHLTLNMISPETHKIVSEVIESCRIR